MSVPQKKLAETVVRSIAESEPVYSQHVLSRCNSFLANMDSLLEGDEDESASMGKLMTAGHAYLIGYACFHERDFDGAREYLNVDVLGKGYISKIEDALDDIADKGSKMLAEAAADGEEVDEYPIVPIPRWMLARASDFIAGMEEENRKAGPAERLGDDDFARIAYVTGLSMVCGLIDSSNDFFDSGVDKDNPQDKDEIGADVNRFALQLLTDQKDFLAPVLAADDKEKAEENLEKLYIMLATLGARFAVKNTTDHLYTYSAEQVSNYIHAYMHSFISAVIEYAYDALHEPYAPDGFLDDLRDTVRKTAAWCNENGRGEGIYAKTVAYLIYVWEQAKNGERLPSFRDPWWTAIAYGYADGLKIAEDNGYNAPEELHDKFIAARDAGDKCDSDGSPSGAEDESTDQVNPSGD
jgi:hypothetical protein